MSRLTIDISDQQHQTLKAMAALQQGGVANLGLVTGAPQ